VHKCRAFKYVCAIFHSLFAHTQGSNVEIIRIPLKLQLNYQSIYIEIALSSRWVCYKMERNRKICIQKERERTVSRTLCKTLLLLIPLIAPIFHGLNYAHLPFAVVRLVALEPVVQRQGEYVYSCSRADLEFCN
jgi:hypothetical protein